MKKVCVKIDGAKLQRLIKLKGLSYEAFGEKYGYSHSWMAGTIKRGQASKAILIALEAEGIMLEDILPDKQEKPVAKAPKDESVASIEGMTQADLYKIIYSAVRAALNG